MICLLDSPVPPKVNAPAENNFSITIAKEKKKAVALNYRVLITTKTRRLKGKEVIHPGQ